MSNSLCYPQEVSASNANVCQSGTHAIPSIVTRCSFPPFTLLSIVFAELTLTPDLPLVVVEPPPSIPPNAITFLACIVGPPGLSVDEYDTQWILPDGQIIPDEPDEGKFRADKGGSAEANNVTIQTTQLLILMLSYQDAGIYRCEVRNASLPGSPWIPASIELQLRGKDRPAIRRPMTDISCMSPCHSEPPDR